MRCEPRFFPELLPDILRNKPNENVALNNIIVVDNIPQVGPDRIDKLKAVLGKHFPKCGRIINDYYPVDENNHTKGYFDDLSENFVVIYLNLFQLYVC